jgi:hypothetical protein
MNQTQLQSQLQSQFIGNNRIIDEYTTSRISFRDIEATENINGLDQVNQPEMDNETIIFTCEKFSIHNEKQIYIEGLIGYHWGDFVSAKFIYDLEANTIYICSRYRLLGHQKELGLFTGTFEVSYDKYWEFQEGTDGGLVEVPDNNNYESMSAIAIPYYRFPRSKDGISIPRAVYNIFKVFQDPAISNKPRIVIPNHFSIYNKIIPT